MTQELKALLALAPDSDLFPSTSVAHLYPYLQVEGIACSLLTSVCWGNAGFGTFHHLDEHTSQVYWVCQDSETKVTETGARAIFVLLVVCFLVQVCLWEMLWHSSVRLLSRPLVAVRDSPFVTLSQSDQEMIHCFSSNEKKTIQNYFLDFSSVVKSFTF